MCERVGRSAPPPPRSGLRATPASTSTRAANHSWDGCRSSSASAVDCGGAVATRSISYRARRRRVTRPCGRLALASLSPRRPRPPARARRRPRGGARDHRAPCCAAESPSERERQALDRCAAPTGYRDGAARRSRSRRAGSRSSRSAPASRARMRVREACSSSPSVASASSSRLTTSWSVPARAQTMRPPYPRAAAARASASPSARAQRGRPEERVLGAPRGRRPVRARRPGQRSSRHSRSRPRRPGRVRAPAEASLVEPSRLLVGEQLARLPGRPRAAEQGRPPWGVTAGRCEQKWCASSERCGSGFRASRRLERVSRRAGAARADAPAEDRRTACRGRARV